MWLSECECHDCKHDWLPLMFGERECTTCGLVEYPKDVTPPRSFYPND